MGSRELAAAVAACLARMPADLDRCGPLPATHLPLLPAA